MSGRSHDIVLLGATGFTGRLVAEALHGRLGARGNARWALAGRDPERLEAVRAGLGAESGGVGAESGTGPALRVVDVTDAAAVDALAADTRVLATTVGPYARYGSEVVAACARHGTHYCDLTGEVPWMRRMIAAHGSTAEASGARIVHACGFDSVPSDLGTWFTQQAMLAAEGVWCAQVKLRVAGASGGVSGGTAASLLEVVEEATRDPETRRVLRDPYALDPEGLERGPDGPDPFTAFRDPDFRAWCGPFVMSAINTRVVRRSHALMGRPWGAGFRYDEAVLAGRGPVGLAAASAVALGTGAAGLFAALPLTRPALRPLLPAPGEGPDARRRERGHFDLRLFGRHPSEPERSLWVRVTGDRDPGYGATSRMLAEAAQCLAFDALPDRSGFLTPATAMGDALLERLRAHGGMGFEVLGSGAHPPA